MSQQKPTNIRVDVHHHHHHHYPQNEEPMFKTRKEEDQYLGSENSFAPRPEIRTVNEK